MDKFDDNHIPTCILDNKTNLCSHMLGPLLHMEVVGQEKALRQDSRT